MRSLFRALVGELWRCGLAPTTTGGYAGRGPAPGARQRASATCIGRGGCARLDGDSWGRGARLWPHCRSVHPGRRDSLVDAFLAYLRPPTAVLAPLRGELRRPRCLQGHRLGKVRLSALAPQAQAGRVLLESTARTDALITTSNLSKCLTVRMHRSKTKLAHPCGSSGREGWLGIDNVWC